MGLLMRDARLREKALGSRNVEAPSEPEFDPGLHGRLVTIESVSNLQAPARVRVNRGLVTN